jgi:hypothetical protein
MKGWEYWLPLALELGMLVYLAWLAQKLRAMLNKPPNSAIQ